ncbi:MAG: LysR family transcriptional regulator [Burkholderiaceae bacterium]
MHEIDLRRVDLNLLLIFDALMTEQNVTRAAERVGRTQSAVSHALGRLREQLSDPLLVKTSGGMQPTPFAEQLIGDVRPILANIRRVLSPSPPFDPISSTRLCRVAIPDMNDGVFPLLVERIRHQSPGIQVEWVQRDEQIVLALAEGRVDVAMVPADSDIPAQICALDIRPLRWASFLRCGHPAIERWSKAQWLAWPHVAVRISERMQSQVQQVVEQAFEQRQVLVRVPHFTVLAPLLARSDLIATLPAIALADQLERYQLQMMKPPIRLAPMPHKLIWHQRLEADPANQWLRRLLAEVYEEVISATEAGLPRVLRG